MKNLIILLLFFSTSTAFSQEIDIVRRYNAVCDKDNYDILQQAINDHPGVTIVIPQGYEILIRQPLNLVSGTKLRVDGNLRLMPGHVKPLQQNALIGDTVIYVDNSDHSFLVGQYVSISSDSMPYGGGGSIARHLAETSQIVAAYTDRIVLRYPLINNIQGYTIDTFKISEGAKLGHTQSVILALNVRDITITGKGEIDGRYPTMYDVHPNSNDPGYYYYRYEELKGGNGIITQGVRNFTLTGITLKETNIAGITLADVDTFLIKDIIVDHPYMKHIAFTVASHGTVENVEMKGSYNEDGLSLHDNVTYSSFKNITIKNCPRLGIGVGSGSHHNTFENISVDSSNLALYTYPGSTSEPAYNNYFKNISISHCTAGLTLARCYNTTFDTLTVSYNSNSNHCITVGGECHDIVFNGGGAYDTKLLNRNGYGYRTVAKESYHLYESYNIIFNQFSFVRLKKALNDSGNSTAVFNQCVFSDNADDGDVSSPDFIINN